MVQYSQEIWLQWLPTHIALCTLKKPSYEGFFVQLKELIILYRFGNFHNPVQ
jgi:hypothetical protein